MSVPRAEIGAQAVLDSLSLRIAVVDDSGTILTVNRSWRDYARDNGADPQSACEGANYLRICDEAEGDEGDEARTFAEGIRQVLDGRLDIYCHDYPCHEPYRQRWFRARVTPIVDADGRKVVIIHTDITARRLIEQS
jgi:PAS domain-containing protein